MDKYLIKNRYLPTIGIECHVQLKTKTKLFAGVANDARDASPNTLISPICLGLPGTLPVLNSEAVKLAIKAGIALNAEIAEISHFDRKHYFYPDLPKGYQITQFERPIVGSGFVEIQTSDGKYKKIRITRAHLEEDAGKSSHPEGANYSLVDLNRAGTPLLEIVSEPDIHSSFEAKAYAHEIYLLMKYADVSYANLFHGNIRFDINVSVSSDINSLGTRTETKNLNSFKSVERAVDYEINRQIELIEKGKHVIQETRGWDDAKQRTFSQRSKEEAHDYRYFPDPDLPPIIVSKKLVDTLVNQSPSMPKKLRNIFTNLGLNETQIETLIEEPWMANLVHLISDEHDDTTAKTIANWLTGEIQRLITTNKLDSSEVMKSAARLVELSSMLSENKVSSTAAKDILLESIKDNKSPIEIAKSNNLLQVSDASELKNIIEKVLKENQKATDDVKNGEEKAIGFLVGQVMKETKGKANPPMVQSLIRKILNDEN